MFSPSAESLGAGGLNPNTNKPVFISASSSLYSPVERPDLTDADKVSYRNVKLTRAIEAIARRDAVYHDLTQENYTGNSITHQVLGTPYPVIEPFPHIFECYKATRWYELAGALACGAIAKVNLRSHASMRHVRNPRGVSFSLPVLVTMFFYTYAAICGEVCFLGLVENEYEADKFGVFDNAANLERKAQNWAKYAAYKNEWMRRFNLSAYGERPEESGKFMSSLMFKPTPVTYNTRTNYPQRKNPMALTTVPLRDFNSDWALTYALPPTSAATGVSDDPYQVGRPELSHRYAGPLANQIVYASQ